MTRISLHKELQSYLKKSSHLEVKKVVQPDEELTTAEAINHLPNTAHSLGELLQLLSERRAHLQGLLGPVLNKISVICYSFSWFEEAIVFQVAVGSYEGTVYFTKVGAKLGYLTVEFIESVLLPYCRGVRKRT